jgi:hypothetical protein
MLIWVEGNQMCKCVILKLKILREIIQTIYYVCILRTVNKIGLVLKYSHNELCMRTLNDERFYKNNSSVVWYSMLIINA